MSIDEYISARKLGEREFRARIQRKEDPYLPVLDDIIADVDIVARVFLGVMTVPLDKVLGTNGRDRTQAFAANFMPILEPESEFAGKWAHLIDSAREEGIRDPIEVMEYLNHFYVVEGNKRASVMKFLDAVSIEASVTRLIPKRTNEKINRIYYEFLDFYYVSSVNYLWFTEEGGFAKVLAHMGKTPDEKWTAEEKQAFFSSYFRFSKEYKALKGKKIPISTGDAFLAYLDIFGYEELRVKPGSQIRSEIRSMWDEFRLRSEEEPVTLLLRPVRESANLLASMMYTAPQTLKVAFVFHKSPLSSGWTYSHDLGRKYVEGVMGNRIVSTFRENVLPEEGEEVIRQLIEEGNQLIFTSSPVFLGSLLKASVENPGVKILNCSLMASYQHIRAYYLRLFEAKFIMGAVAGAVSPNGRIGYVADYPIYGMPASINAFALGAALVNPEAKIYLEWSTIVGHDPNEIFRQNSVTVISNKDIGAPLFKSNRFGLYRETENGPVTLATPIWHWGRMYEEIIRSVLNGSWKTPESGKPVRALNYWWGMDSDSVDIRCSDAVPASTRRLADILRVSLQHGMVNPFSGRLFSQGRKPVNPEGEPLTPAEVVTMHWLNDNVIGEIPETETLTDDAKQIVTIQGLKGINELTASQFTW